MEINVEAEAKDNGDAVFTVTEEDGQVTVVELNTPAPEVWRQMTNEEKNEHLQRQLDEYSNRVVEKIGWALSEMKAKNVHPMGDRRVDGREAHKPEFIPENLS